MPATPPFDRRDLAATLAVAALALTEAAQVYVGLALQDADFSWGRAVRSTAPSWGVLLVLLLPLFRVLDRLAGVPLRRRVPALAAVGGGFAVAHLAGSAWLGEWVGPVSVGFAAHAARLGTVYFVPDLLTYLAVVTVHEVARRAQADRLRELEAETARADRAQERFQALRGQLRPDFFFNTLNAVAGLVARGDARRSVDALSALSGLLRVGLTVEPGCPRPLDDEMELVAAYLSIQGLRFPGRVRGGSSVEDGAGTLAAPALLLVRLVEAVVDRGLGAGGPFEVRVRARAFHSRLEVDVDHSAPELDVDLVVGLEERLRRLDPMAGVQAQPGRLRLSWQARPAAAVPLDVGRPT